MPCPLDRHAVARATSTEQLKQQFRTLVEEKEELQTIMDEALQILAEMNGHVETEYNRRCDRLIAAAPTTTGGGARPNNTWHGLAAYANVKGADMRELMSGICTMGHTRVHIFQQIEQLLPRLLERARQEGDEALLRELQGQVQQQQQQQE